MPMTIIES